MQDTSKEQLGHLSETSLGKEPAAAAKLELEGDVVTDFEKAAAAGSPAGALVAAATTETSPAAGSAPVGSSAGEAPVAPSEVAQPSQASKPPQAAAAVLEVTQPQEAPHPQEAPWSQEGSKSPAHSAAQNTVGIGVDLISVARVKKALERRPSFCKRVFSSAEIRYCEKQSRPEEHYAARFAAREAVLKALGLGLFSVGRFDVTVEHDKKGAPLVKLAGRAQEVAEKAQLTLALSLSHTREVAIANAVALSEAHRPQLKPEEKKDLLTKNFREVRKLLAHFE